MFDGDHGFVMLHHQFLMMNKGKGGTGMVHQEHFPLCRHTMETLVSPSFLDSLEGWLDSTQSKLSKFDEEFGDSLTTHRVCALETHSPLVELEVGNQFNWLKKIKKLLMRFIDPQLGGGV